MPPHESPHTRPSPAEIICSALAPRQDGSPVAGWAEKRTAAVLDALTAAGYVFTDTAAIERSAEVLNQLRGHAAALKHVIDAVGIDPDLTRFRFTVIHPDGRREPVATILVSELQAMGAAAIAAAVVDFLPPAEQPATEGPAS